MLFLHCKSYKLRVPVFSPYLTPSCWSLIDYCLGFRKADAIHLLRLSSAPFRPRIVDYQKAKLLSGPLQATQKALTSLFVFLEPRRLVTFRSQ